MNEKIRSGGRTKDEVEKNESHESYLNNYLEVEANRFAQEMMEELFEKGYVSKI